MMKGEKVKCDQVMIDRSVVIVWIGYIILNVENEQSREANDSNSHTTEMKRGG